MRVRALSVHAGYACAQSGACCRAGWTIPVDRVTRRRIDAHLAAGDLDAPAVAPCFATYEAGDRASIAFAHDDAGACAFLARDGSEACTIHGALGHEALPMTCRQFPRVAVVGDGWTDVSLSHFCPTAAAHLVDATTPLTIIDDPACARGRALDGLDVRGHFPPLLRPGALHSLESWRRLEEAAVHLFDCPGPPGQHLGVLAGWLRAVEAWTPAHGALEPFVARAVTTPSVMDGRAAAACDPGTRAVEDWTLAWTSVPRARATRPACPPAHDVARAAAALDADARPVNRYLATKLVASWVPWLATRSTTTARAVEVAHHVVLVEAARAAGTPGRAALVHAVRQADLLLVHLSEPAVLVGLLEGRGEAGRP